MSKHTPGPWLTEKVVAGKPPDRGVGIIAVDPEISRTEIRTPTRGIVAWACGRVGQPSAETLANAHLISAAPEMLVALKAIVAADDAAMAELGQIGMEVSASTRAHTERARAAIAKAEGKSP